jgi:hypothetical protein
LPVIARAVAQSMPRALKRLNSGVCTGFDLRQTSMTITEIGINTEIVSMTKLR